MHNESKVKFNPMSDDPEVRSYTQSRCLDAMHLINLFVNAYDKHRYDKTNTIKNFNFINSMDTFRKECNLYGWTNDE